jgi:hypothetical protein
MISKFEANMVHIPDYEPLIKQLHSLKASKTSSGMTRLSGKKSGHDDITWAFGLAMYPSIDEMLDQDIEAEILPRNIRPQKIKSMNRKMMRMNTNGNFPFY